MAVGRWSRQSLAQICPQRRRISQISKLKESKYKNEVDMQIMVLEDKMNVLKREYEDVFGD